MNFAIYDSSGELLGYKAGAHWETSHEPDRFSLHQKIDSNLDSKLFDYLLHLINSDSEPVLDDLRFNVSYYNTDKSIYIVTEDANLGDALSGFHLKCDDSKKYFIPARNDFLN